MFLVAESLPLLLLFPATLRAACYFPDGGLSSFDVPCDDSASESFCCFGGQACLSNKLCYDPASLRFARGTCTDPNWESAACPKFCLDAVALGNPVFSCNTSSSDSYCCNNGCSCASGSTNEIHTFTGTPYTMTIIGSPQTFANPSSTIATSASPSSTSELTILPKTTSSTSGSSPTPSASSSKSSSSSNGLKIGVGVAAAALVAMVAAAVFFRWRKTSWARRVLRRAPTVPLPIVPDKGYAAGGGGPGYGPGLAPKAELSAHDHYSSRQHYGPNVQELGAPDEGRVAELPAQQHQQQQHNL